MDLSVVVPLYNEEENIKALHHAIRKVLDGRGYVYEVIFVDDGSSDHTFDLLRDLALQDSHIRVIKFRRNYGQTSAMAAGIEYACGRLIVTMDGDLQNDPADIPHFIERIDDGYDVVVGWRHKRQDKLVTRKIPSQLANWLIGKVTGVPIKDNGCSLKGYRAEVVKSVPLYSEMHRFIPAMLSLTGARLIEIKVAHHPRRRGVSKYGLSRIYKVLLDLLVIKTLVSFTSRPLLWSGILSLPALLISAITLSSGVYRSVAYGEFFYVPLAGTGVLYGALAFLLLLGGMLGELIYKTGNVRLERLSLLTTKSQEPLTKATD